MTATTADRRSGYSAPPRRELPVLFHLLDVSREASARQTPCDALPESPAEDSLVDLTAAQCEEPAPSFEPLPSPEPPPAPSLSITLSGPPSSFDPTPTPGGSEIFDEPLPASIETDSPFGVIEAEEVAEPLPAAGDASLSGDSAAAPTQSVAAPASPRSTPASKRKSNNPPRDDWFAQHGKYIAIGFALALIGTIYLARSNRGTGGQADRIPTHDHPGTAGELAISIPEPATATVLGEAKPLHGNPASGASEVSPAQLVEAASGSSKAELHPPAAPEVASSETNSNQDLFSFAKKGEQRVAARPAGPTPIENHTLEAADAESATPAYPQTPYPAEIPAPEKPPLPQAYPTTGAPETVTQPPAQQPQPQQQQPYQPPQAQYGPPAPQYGQMPAQYQSPPPQYQSPPPQYPPNPPANYGPPPAQQPAPPAGSAPPSIYGYAPPATPAGAMPPPYQPENNSARGIRYERTGSGLY